MKGLLDQDKDLQVKSLLGLIKASETLGLDPTRYKNALKTIRPDLVEKKEKKGSKSRSSKKKNASNADTTGKKVKLLSSKVENGRLQLKFSGNISKENLRHFILERNGNVLYVYDISPVRLPWSIKRIKGSGFKEIRIAQYDPKKIRIVVETAKPYKPHAKTSGHSLEITLPGYQTSEKSKKAVAKTSNRKKQNKKVSKSSKTTAKSGNEKALSSSMLRRYTVVLDPGHGGKDAGAVGYQRRKEKDAVLAVAKQLKKVLKKRGFNVYLTRERDVFIPLKKRTRFANRKQADFFISIHANAAANKRNYLKSKGIETYFLSRARSGRAKRVAAIENSAEIKNIDRYTKDAYLSVLNREKIIESNKLAIDLQRQMLTSVRKKYSDVVDNGVREGPFWVLVGAQMPAVLIEIGYITHPTEARRLFNPYYQKLMAEGIANGIESYIYHNK